MTYTVDDVLPRMQAWRDTFEQSLRMFRDEATGKTSHAIAGIVGVLDAAMAEILALRAERDALRAALLEVVDHPNRLRMDGTAAVIARAREGTS